MTESNRSILAIDPGTRESGWALLCGVRGKGAARGGIEQNEAILKRIDNCIDDDAVLVVERITSYGQHVGKTVFETCEWAGRFVERGNGVFMSRRDMKRHLGMQAGDSDRVVRQEMIVRFGGCSERAIGTKAQPGPLYGFRSHMWQALALAVAYETCRQWKERGGCPYCS